MITLLALGFSVASDAQSAHPKHKAKTEERKKMMEAMNLTDDQSKQFKELTDDFTSKMQDIKKDSTLSKDEKRKQMQTLNRERKTRIDAILTPEQHAKMKEMRKQSAK